MHARKPGHVSRMSPDDHIYMCVYCNLPLVIEDNSAREPVAVDR